VDQARPGVDVIVDRPPFRSGTLVTNTARAAPATRFPTAAIM